MVRYLFYTIGDLTYQSPLVPSACIFRLVLQTKLLIHINNSKPQPSERYQQGKCCTGLKYYSHSFHIHMEYTSKNPMSFKRSGYMRTPKIWRVKVYYNFPFYTRRTKHVILKLVSVPMHR